MLRQSEDRSANVAMDWVPEDRKRTRGRPQKRPGVRHNQNIYKAWV